MKSSAERKSENGEEEERRVTRSPEMVDYVS